MRVRLALENLGPTFAKLGQVLASRGDLLPPEYVDELSLLQSGVTAVPFEELRDQLVLHHRADLMLLWSILRSGHR